MKKAHTAGRLPARNVILEFLIAKRVLLFDTISALFILLFVYTAIYKFIAIPTLRIILKDYPLIGGIPKVVAWGLPITEVFVSLLLFIPRTRLLGLYCSLGLITVFTLYLGYMISVLPNLPCTCGGMLETLSWPQHIVFNVFLILLASMAIWLHKKGKSLHS